MRTIVDHSLQVCLTHRKGRNHWALAASARPSLLLTALAGIAAMLASGSGCERRRVLKPPPPPAVTVARPVQREVIEWDEYTGHLDAVDTVEVQARVSGLVMAADFQEGAIVKKGDLLIEIDVRPFQADLDSKMAAEGQAAAQVDLAKITYDHMKELMPGQSASTIEYQQADAKDSRINNLNDFA